MEKNRHLILSGESTIRKKERGIQLRFENEQTKIQFSFKITLRLTQVGELSIHPPLYLKHLN